MEGGRLHQVPFADVLALASAVKADPYWLFTGEDYGGLSPWIQQMREYDRANAIDERGVDTLLREAAAQAEITARTRSQMSHRDVVIERLLANDPRARAQYDEWMQEELASASEAEPPAQPAASPSRRRRARQ